MDEKLQKALESTLELIETKKEEFKDVKGMERLIGYLDESVVNAWIKVQSDELDEDWLNAVKADIKWMERACKAEAGLLSPEEAAARKKFVDFLNSPCDLPPDVK